MTDLMFKDALQAVVRDAYRAIEDPRGAGAGLYSPGELAELPEPALAWSLGVGNPVGWAELAPGEVVLDIGAGAGIDSILAARRVLPGGRVIGLDLLPEMCERARANAAAAGLGNTEFREGEMEAIPLPDASIDVVISNGVINLSARKARVLAECARVLRPGGRLCVADLTVDEEDLPPEVLTHPSAWAG